jgi:hypothetical protein
MNTNAFAGKMTVNCVKDAVLQSVKAIPELLILEDGMDTLSQNISNQL